MLINRARLRFIAGTTLSGVAIAVILGAIEFLDRPAAFLAHTVSNNAILTTALIVGVFGSPIPYFLISPLAFVYFKFQQMNAKRAHRAALIMFASTVAPFIADMLKLVFGRSRPHLLFEKDVFVFRPLTNSLDFSSFPSEHSAVAFAMAASFSILFPGYRPTFFFLATIVAVSRFVVGVHYPSDLIAGGMVGLLTVAILIPVLRRYRIEVCAIR
jgi:membrane-associated phospholipid phosphatase